jgi:hypothetical protein
MSSAIHELTIGALTRAVNNTAAIMDKAEKHADKMLPTFMDDARAMSAVDYAARVIVPDVNFHAVAAYAILRHNGVPLSKSDFLGELRTVAAK